MNEIKYCEDCKHSTGGHGVTLRCGNLDLSLPASLVCRQIGADRMPYCALMRDDERKCGKSAVFFEFGPKNPPRKWWKIWG